MVEAYFHMPFAAMVLSVMSLTIPPFVIYFFVVSTFQRRIAKSFLRGYAFQIICVVWLAVWGFIAPRLANAWVRF